MLRKIELLSPARDVEIGKAAFDHGADAVYIGAPKFSARAAAGNEIGDIEQLARYGHRFGAKTFVAFNTLLRDRELEAAEKMAWQLYEAGTDALIVQDLGLLKLNLPPIELHASTQTDNRTIEKVRLMRDLGMTRVVLARELSIEEIKEIHKVVPDVELECFVHGALCVCVSGQCYLSAAIASRSANRGACAQPCRLPMDLINAKGQTIVKGKHLLSLKDMNRSALLEDLIESGVTSLKIEGRLKDISYVKNVTAYYRRELDRIIEGHPDWQHISEGKVYFTFEPDVAKSFNRGFTEYQKNRETYWNFETPKSVGEYIGKVSNVTRKNFIVEGKRIANGDGLMVGTLGFRANKVEGAAVTPLDPEILLKLKPGMEVWRNSDIHFEQRLEKPSSKRKIPIDIFFEHDDSFATLKISDGKTTIEVRRGPFPIAEKPREGDFYQGNLTKLGDTIFEVQSFNHRPQKKNDGSPLQLLIMSSALNEMRRAAVALLEEKRIESVLKERDCFVKPDYSKNAKNLDARDIIPTDFRANALNHSAKEILQEMRLEKVADAFEKQQDNQHPIMTTRHCLKYALGHCPKYGSPMGETAVIKQKLWVEPMVLKIGDKKFFIKFGCKNLCMSEIFSIFAPESN